LGGVSRGLEILERTARQGAKETPEVQEEIPRMPKRGGMGNPEKTENPEKMVSDTLGSRSPFHHLQPPTLYRLPSPSFLTFLQEETDRTGRMERTLKKWTSL
jgi:hypothetical protein